MRLPAPLRSPLERLVRDMLDVGAGADFSRPVGEPALVGSDSVSWRVFANPVTLFIGGVTAVILELAEPRVRAGVWGHTSFRTDPLTRLRRTGLAAMVTVYGAASVAEAMIADIGRRHAAVSGVTDSGQAYSAADPELLDWVQATAAFGFLDAYATYARPLSASERDRYWAEGRAAATLYGATAAPTSEAGWAALLERTLPRLEPSGTVDEFLTIMSRVPLLPGPGRLLQGGLVRAAIALTPEIVRERLGLAGAGRLSATDRMLVRAAVRAADRLVLDAHPAVQSCRRLGLPADYLYR